MNIEKADLGYDEEGVRKFLDDLKINLIEKLISDINKYNDGIKRETHQCWKGAAADAFINKFDVDSDFIKDSLKGINNDVFNSFQKIVKNVDVYDQAIADQIKG